MGGSGAATAPRIDTSSGDWEDGSEMELTDNQYIF